MRLDAALVRQRCIELATEGRGLKAIASELAVTHATVRRHLSRPDVVAELRRLQDERLRAIARRALAASEVALDVLIDVATNGRVPMARVIAARSLLDINLRLIETAELADRIAALEDQLRQGQWAPRAG